MAKEQEVKVKQDIDLEVKKQSQSAATAEVQEDDMAQEVEGQNKKKKRKRNKKKKNNKAMSELDTESVDADERRNNYDDSERGSPVSQRSGVRGYEEPEFTPLKEKLEESFFED